MFTTFWPFDFSCSGIAITAVCILFFILIGLAQAAEKTVDVAKKVASSETVQEASRGIFAAWLNSTFKK